MQLNYIMLKNTHTTAPLPSADTGATEVPQKRGRGRPPALKRQQAAKRERNGVHATQMKAPASRARNGVNGTLGPSREHNPHS